MPTKTKTTRIQTRVIRPQQPRIRPLMSINTKSVKVKTQPPRRIITKKPIPPKQSEQPRKPRNKTKLKNKNKKMDMYTMCRLFPFSSRGTSSGIPDKSDVNRIINDHRMMNTFTIGDCGEITIIITPFLPSSVWYNTPVADPSFKVNGVGGFSRPLSSYSGYYYFTQPQWGTKDLKFLNTEGNYDNVEALYDANRMRLVTAGWKITFAGSITQSAGYITVNEVNTTVSNTSLNPSSFYVLHNNNASTFTSYNKGQVFVSILENAGFTLAANTVRTRSGPLRQGMHGILKHGSDEFEWRPVYHDVNYLAYPTNQQYSILQRNDTFQVNDTCATYPVVSYIDNDWNSTVIRITGAEKGQTIILDTLYCVEYQPSRSSDTYAIAKPGPRPNQNVLNETQKLATKAPIAAPNDRSILDTIVEVGSVAVPLAASLLV